ncbi:MAG: PEP/pyruvate-binding domain-containing protein [Thermodesulfobacteriota bacterium]|nr:PEP/pyruvate-binding domain-containing protein [Thermodesulfobacteriota bacterium]
MIASEALRVNLEATAVREVKYDSRYQVLRDAVKDYQGIIKAVDSLLFELHHPFRNWEIIVGDLRSFALKNLATYSRSSQGSEAIRVLLDTFSDVISKAPGNDQKTEAVNGLLAFLEKIIQKVDTEKLLTILPDIEHTFHRLKESNAHVIKSVAKSYHTVSHLIQNLSNRLEGQEASPGLWDEAGRLLIEVQKATSLYWLEQEDPVNWLNSAIEQFSMEPASEDLKNTLGFIEPVSHKQLKSSLENLRIERKAPLKKKEVLELARRPGYLDIVDQYRKIVQDLGRLSCQIPPVSSKKQASRNQDAELYLLLPFHLIEIEGLSTIHEEILRQINRSLLYLIRTADLEQLQKILSKSFALLKQQVGNFPRTALQCIEALGSEVVRRDDTRLIELFLNQVVQFGFQPPGIKGVDAEWHILSDPAHLQNIRVWLKFAEQRTSVCGTLLSALIINLKLAGTCIRDTDLFQKDVSRLLNCDIEPTYNLAKQLAKILPVYFNEIGAEGLLRDVSTELDEISHRKDMLIHFLRKQSHVESNNRIVDFIEAILCFWFSRQKEGLTPFLPPEILKQVPDNGPHVDHVHRLIQHLADVLDLKRLPHSIDSLPNLEQDRLSQILGQVPDIPHQERRRVELLIRMYRLEVHKYKLGTQEIRHHLEEAKNLGFEGLDKVLEILDIDDDPERCLEVILDQLDVLKGIILSKEQFEIREDIYHKRHITVDIPSMYGRYHERKFDALSLSFRLENLANIHFEQLIAEIDSTFISRSIFARILRYLRLFWRAVQLDGVYSRKFATYLGLLEKSLDVRRFAFSQYLDVVRGLSEGVKDIIHVYYISPHQDNISLIIRQLGKHNLLPKYKTAIKEAENETQLIHQITEWFLRDLISGTFGLQYLDNFIARVYQVLGEQKERLDHKDLDLLLSYDPNQILCTIHSPQEQTKNLIHLGNKGFNLVLLAQQGMPVPPGVIVTTEVFRCYPIIRKLPSVYREFRLQLQKAIREIEHQTGRRFGDPSNPLLLSVRSGAAISMPGMMSTIINVGSNLEIIEGLAKKTGNAWFAWDNYRRFVQSWAMAFDLDREMFTELISNHKRRYGVKQKREFTGDQMKELAMAYRQATLDHGLELEVDPFEQLFVAIRLILTSWESEKAKNYREIMEMSDYWGTAVILQAMAYGNLAATSGTGVAFTPIHTDHIDNISLWGDFTTGNQGDDIVSGLVTTYPISIKQQKAMGLDSEMTLEKNFPEIYNKLLSMTRELIYEKRWDPQEIEFTFEGPESNQLFILQSRNMTTKRRYIVQVFVHSAELEANYLGRGIGVSGGAMTGKAVFTLSEIKSFCEKEPKTPLILIRSDTVPDDIKEITLTDGLLTAKGGQTSHAAIIAFRLDKNCIVGCKQLQVFENMGFARLHDRIIRSGDFLSIDGRNGSIYMGKHAIQIEEEMSLV